MHAIHLVRLHSQFWTQSMGSLEETTSCSECSSDTKCRLECKGCSKSICLECYGGDKRASWFEHRFQHTKGNTFEQLLTPTFRAFPPPDHQCDCSRSHGVISHCGGCFRGRQYSMSYLFPSIVATIQDSSCIFTTLIQSQNPTKV